MGQRLRTALAFCTCLVVAAPAVAQDATPALQPSPWSDPQFAWGVGLTATGGVLFLASGYTFYRSVQTRNDDGFEDYRRTVTADTDPCDAAKAEGRSDIVEICDSNSRHTTLTYVLAPLALVSTGAGLYLLATRDDKTKKETAGVRLEPRVDHRGGALFLNGHF